MNRRLVQGWLVAVLALGPGLVTAADPDPKASSPAKPAAPVALNPAGTVLLDAANKKLLVKSRVCLREGMLEMLLTIKQTKEHESILAVDSPAQVVHAGLLALGVPVGKPVQFSPQMVPPQGTKIKITAVYTDKDGKEQRVPAQSWIRSATRKFFVQKLKKLPADLKIPEDSGMIWDERNGELLWYGPMSAAQRDEWLKRSKDADYLKAIKWFFEATQYKTTEADFVFAGSMFQKDPETGKNQYLAEGGDLICVANFPTATIDIAIPSSASGDDLLFEAYTERIPPIDTPVTLELAPVFEAPNGAAAPQPAAPTQPK